METGHCERAIILLSRMKPGSGNHSTVTRLRCHFEPRYKCVTVDTDSIGCVEDLQQLVDSHRARLIIGLHAYHAGQWLKDVSCCPYGLIFGGTDLSEYRDDVDKMNIMRQAIAGARMLVAFSIQMASQAEMLWPDLRMNKLQVIPQGVITCVSPQIEVCIHTRYGLPEAADVIVMVGALRPVKDQLFLLDEFSAWHRTSNNNVYLAIVGPVSNEEYGARVLNKIENCPGILYLGRQSIQDTHCLIQKAVVLVNSSLSEGQAVAVLEAQALRTPVIVRDIAANLDIVKHGHSGLVYSTPQDFIVELSKLLKDRALQLHLVTNAAHYVDSRHSLHAEKTYYLQIVRDMAT